MRRVNIGIAAAMLCTCALTVASYAQETTSDVAIVDTCMNLETREQLLACYEDRVDEVLRAREADGDTNVPETTAVSDAPTPAAEAAAAAEDPGYTAGEIIANITTIREMEPDAYLITLDNGQVWLQNAPKRYLLRIGAEVHIRPSTWGPSYRLTDPNVGNYIQVKRVE